jgi:outer membrane protein insertion porin family
MNLFKYGITATASVFLLAFSSLIFAESLKIASVDVEGNITISTTKILSVIQTRRGQSFDEDILRNDSRNIAAIEGVEYAYYSTETGEKGADVTFVVVEKKLVREIAFFGNRKLKDGFLRKQVNLVKGDYLDTLEIARALNEIRDAYSKKGYYFSEVELDKQALEDGRVLFRIQEGESVKVDGVAFEGNTVFSDKELKKVVKLRKRRFLLFTTKLNDDKLSEEVERIINVYRENGYIDVSCSFETQFNEKLNKAVVVFYIDEGKEYQTASITLSGNEFFSDQELLAAMKLSEGDVFDVNKADFDKETISNMYREIGFIEANVNMTRRYAEDDKISIEYTIAEGSRFRIGRVDITGNSSTHDKVVRRELDEVDFRPGRWYNAKAARGNGQGTLENDVKRASLAESVLITPVDAGEDQKTAVVDITEGQTGMVMFGAGIDSSNGVIGQVILEQRNFDITDWPESFEEFIKGQAFKGAGQRMRLTLEPGTEVTRYSIDFTDPYAWDKPLNLNVGSSKYERGRESYDEERLKGYVGVTRRYRDGWALGMRFRAESVDIDPDADAPYEVWDADGSNTLFGTKFVAIKNNTDSRYMPTKGDSYEVNYEQVFGDYNFGVVTGIYRWYKTLTEDLARRKTVLATKLQASSIIGDAPVFEKFYAGGTGSLRGFDYRGVSPRGESVTTGEYDDPIGSDWLVLANAEITIPLSSDTFNWLLFCDTGMVEDNTFRSAVGVGIEIMLPQWFGPVPMRFELAAPITKDESDDTRVFSFSMGRLF